MAMDSFTSSDDLTDILKIQLSSLAALITEDGYELVCNQAEQELGWSYPITDPTRLFWVVKRATRHALNLLKIASANKFKYKQVNLQNRFEHFQKLIEDMDKEFEEAMSSDIGLFAGIDSYKMFGTKIDAGFAYTRMGKDVTYNSDRYVNFAPLAD
ncbi:MAG: hypothetical protein WC346_00220 [Methanogenium sp.]|jgi:hypothetical protein